MITVIEMSTGKKIEEPDAYSDEVLNANWLPQPELQLGLQTVTPAKLVLSEPALDAESFLRQVYSSQE